MSTYRKTPEAVAQAVDPATRERARRSRQRILGTAAAATAMFVGIYYLTRSRTFIFLAVIALAQVIRAIRHTSSAQARSELEAETDLRRFQTPEGKVTSSVSASDLSRHRS